MKTRLLLLMAFVYAVFSSFGQDTLDTDATDGLQTALRDSASLLNFYEIQNKATEYFVEKFAPDSVPDYNLRMYNGPDGLAQYLQIDGEYAKYKRWEWYWRNRIMPDSSFPDLLSIYTASGGNSRVAANPFSGLTWNNINQTHATGGYNGMGRTTAIAFHPSDANTFYVGAPVGGIWKTTDGGNTYTPLGDHLPYVSVGNIVVDYQNPNTIYISIGDDMGWWNYSLGVYKSTDGGNTWNSTGFVRQFTDGLAIYRMEMSPTDPNVLMIATTQGLFRTGDAGVTWQKIRNGEHRDVKFKPGDGNVVYAAFCDWYTTSEVYKSIDGGLSFTKKTNLNSVNNSMILTVTPANPDIVAFLTSKEKAFYLSKDGGESFTFKTDVSESAVLYASPVDPSVFYCGAVNVYKSTDEGADWNQITIWYGGGAYTEVHADQHFVKHNPLNNSIYFCNDGGLYQYNESTDQWKEHSNGLIITQFYSIAVAQTDPVIMVGGSQDNGGRKRQANGTWTATNGGDAMVVAMDPTDANVLYTTYANGQIYRSLDGWNKDTYHSISDNIPGKPTGDWETPYILDPNDHNTVVAGYQDVFRSHDRGDTWEQLSTNITGSSSRKLLEVAVAKGNSSVIYTSQANQFFYTTNAGQTWGSYTFNNYDNITSIAVHPTNPNKVFVTFAGYRAGKKISLSTDGGKTWSDYSGTLPNVPANSFIVDEAGNEAYYVGTDYGVFYRDASTSDWERYGSGLPNTNVTQLCIQRNTGMLRIATFGRGIWEIPLWSKAPQLIAADATPDSLVSGVRYVYYEGDWTLLPDFTNLKNILVTKGGVVSDVSLDQIPARNDSFAVRYTAFLEVPQDGLYTFYLDSDDGSKLYISDSLIINHDSIHAATEYSVPCGLKKGYHKLVVEYFQAAGGELISLGWDGAGFIRRNISADLRVEKYIYTVPATIPSTLYSSMYGLHANDAVTYEGWVDAGDTIRFTVNAPASTDSYYKIYLSYAAPEDGRLVNQWLDGSLVTTDTLPSSGGWGVVKEAPVGEIRLSGGQHTLTFSNSNNVFDYYALRLVNNDTAHTDCNGVLDGTAYMDVCGTCVGGNTGRNPCTVTALSQAQQLSDFKLYPNPFEESIFLEIADEAQVEIYSLTGIRVWQGLVKNGTISPKIRPGAYMMRILQNGLSATRMITKSNR